jgi:hypothetical protein
LDSSKQLVQPGLTLRCMPLRQAQQLAAQVAQLQEELQQAQQHAMQQLVALQAEAGAQVEQFKAQWQQEFDRRRRLHDQVRAGGVGGGIAQRRATAECAARGQSSRGPI